MSNPQINACIAWAHANHDSLLDSFRELLKIPSISTDPKYNEEVLRAANWIVAEMTRIGFDHAQAIETGGHPMVYSDWLHAGADKPTILVYAHYDVQPVEPLSNWTHDPFGAEIIDGKICARGAMDDKCGVMINLKAFETMLMVTGTLPVNVKVIFEGEEESGSPSMLAAIEKYKELLAADLVIISDGGYAPEQPYVISSVRGIVDGEIVVRGPRQDLHSGKFGGVVHNPAHVVGKMIAALHDENGRVQIPGFYDDVVGASSAEKAAFADAEEAFTAYGQTVADVKQFWGMSEYSFLERIASQPTCDVNGIFGGYQGEGMMTIIPALAGFKVSLRLVANQDPDDIVQKFEAFVRSFEVPTVTIELAVHSGSHPAKLLSEGPVVEAMQDAFSAIWGKRGQVLGLGGSVPITGMFQQVMGVPITMFGFGIGDGQHAPNEFIYLREFQRGIDTAIHFYHNLAGAM